MPSSRWGHYIEGRIFVKNKEALLEALKAIARREGEDPKLLSEQDLLKEYLPLPSKINQDNELVPDGDQGALDDWDDPMLSMIQNCAKALDVNRSWLRHVRLCISGHPRDDVSEWKNGKLTHFCVQSQDTMEILRYVRDTMKMEDAPKYLKSKTEILQLVAEDLLEGKA